VARGDGYVDLELVTADAIYRDDEGTEHVVEWVTRTDVDLARAWCVARPAAKNV